MPQFLTNVIYADATNVSMGTTTGTKIGTATSQKLAFYNATPIIQPTGDLLVALTNLGLAATPALPSGQAFLASTFTISAALGTFVDTGLAVALPSAGTYLILYNVRGVANIADAKVLWITAKLYQTDSSAFVTNSERYVVTADTTSSTAFLNHDFANQSAFSAIVTVTAACSIKLYVKRDGSSATINYALIYSDAAAGWTALEYIKIG